MAGFTRGSFDQKFGGLLLANLTQTIRDVCRPHNINPLYACLFGSQAKGYASASSDLDFYVVYVGPVTQYAKLLNVDTKQVARENALPPQVTLEVVSSQRNDEVLETREVQLNFVSLDHWTQEIGRGNLDFRIGHDNRLIKLGGDLDALFMMIDEFAKATYDPEKLRHSCASRAKRVMLQLKDVQAGAVSEMPKHSEITDGIYRLFLSWAATSTTFSRELLYSNTLTLAELMDGYLRDVALDQEVAFMRRNLITHLHDGLFKSGHVHWHNTIIKVFDRLVPQILKRAIKASPMDRSIDVYLQHANRLNTYFADMLIEGGV